jgi:predicted DCC family thiol-disulfide oxidoreductase YuxK
MLLYFTGVTPTLVFDGDCGFCRRWIARWQARTQDRVVYVPLQEPGVLARLGIPLSDALRAVQLVDSDGRHYAGAEAVFRTLERAPGRHVLLRFLRLPPLVWLAELVYRFIARRRASASRVEKRLSHR